MQELSRENENLQDSLKQCNKNAGAERKAVPDAKLSSNEETAKQRSLSLTHTAIAQKSSKLPSQLTTEQQETSSSSSSTKLLPKSLDEDAEAGQIQKPVPDGGVGIVPNRDQELEANVQVFTPFSLFPFPSPSFSTSSDNLHQLSTYFDYLQYCSFPNQC